jgi:TPR repeat protein
MSGKGPELLNLGKCYEEGIGTPCNPNMAISCYRAAAKQGSGPGYSDLGRMLKQNPSLVAPGDPTPNQCFKTAAHLGDLFAMCEYADILMDEGRKANESKYIASDLDAQALYTQAIDLLKRAALRDYPTAQRRLAHFTGSSDAGKRAALNLLEKAAAQEDMNAQYELAYCHECGIGCPKDPWLALQEYLAVAAREGENKMAAIAACKRLRSESASPVPAKDRSPDRPPPRRPPPG